MFAVSPFVRVKLLAVGDDQPEVADAGLIQAGIENFGQDPRPIVNQTWLAAPPAGFSAVPTPSFCAGAQRGFAPGLPGAMRGSPF